MQMQAEAQHKAERELGGDAVHAGHPDDTGRHGDTTNMSALMTQVCPARTALATLPHLHLSLAQCQIEGAAQVLGMHLQDTSQ